MTGVGAGVASHQVRALDRRARRRAADHAAARQHVPQGVVHLGVQVGVGQAPLASAGEPDASGSAKRLREGVGVGHLGVVGVEDGYVAGAGVLEGSASPEELVVVVGAARRGDDDDGRGRPAGQLHEALEDGGIAQGASGDDQAAVLGADLLGRGGGGCGWKDADCCREDDGEQEGAGGAGCAGQAGCASRSAGRLHVGTGVVRGRRAGERGTPGTARS